MRILPLMMCGLLGCASTKQSPTVEPIPEVLPKYTDVILYNGEFAKFSSWSKWDGNDSTIWNSRLDPHSKPYSIRARINVRNWWGAAAYVLNNWNPVDLSKGTNLTFYAKASVPVNVLVNVFDGTSKGSNTVEIALEKTYKKFIIPLRQLEGADLTKVNTLVFAISERKAMTYNIYVDDITLDGVLYASRN